MVRLAFLLNFPLEYKGGINYLKNLFYAVNKYYSDKIKIVLFVPKNLEAEYLDAFSPYSEIIKTNILQRKTLPWFISRVAEKYVGFDPFVYQLIKNNNIDCVSHSNYVFPSKSIRSINWIPDFQYVHYPYLWSKKDVNTVSKFHKKINQKK